MLTASVDKTAKVWSAASGECLRTLMGHTCQVKSAVFSPDGQQVLTASRDGTAKVWSAASGACLLTLMGHTCPSQISSLLARRPAGADRFPRRDREGVVGCLGCMLAYLDGSHKPSQISSLLARWPVGADRISRGTRRGALAHLERPQRLCEFFSVLSLRLTTLPLHQVGGYGASICVGGKQLTVRT